MYSQLQTAVEQVPAPAQFLLMLVAWSLVVECSVRFVGLFVRKRSASTRSFVYQAGFLALVMAPVGYFCLPGIALFEMRPIHSNSIATAVSNSRTTSPSELETLSERRDEQNADASLATSRQVAVRPQRHDSLSLRNRFGLKSFLSAVTFAWAAIASWMLLRLAIVHWRQRQLVKESEIVVDTHWRSIVNRIAWHSRLNPERIEIRTGDNIPIPMVTGLFRTLILLPPQYESWSRADREMVLRHEMAHLKRRDLHWQFLALIVRAVYWFQPLTWRSWQKLQVERECACDDIALNQGARPTSFATMLHKMAAEYAGAAVPGGIAMAERYRLEERVARALSDAPRNSLTRRQHVVGMSLAIILALMMTSLRPFATKVLADPSPPLDESQAEVVVLPNKLKGKVVTTDAQPIANAKVKVELIHYYGHDDDWEVVRQWNTISDQDGEYVIDLGGKIRQPKSRFVITSATAQGYADASSGWGHWVQGIAERGSISSLEMKQGRMLSGKVVGPDGVPISNAKIKKLGGWPLQVGKEIEYWFPELSECDDSGRFAFGYPKDEDAVVSLIFFAKGFASRHLRVRAEDDLGEIRLDRGTTVEGIVADTNGQPMAGVCVAATQAWTDAEIRNCGMGVSINLATLTDDRGKFKLDGIGDLCLIRLAASSRDEGEKCVRGRPDPPIVSPTVVKAGSSQDVITVDFKQASTVTVAGQINWIDGEPAAGVEIKTSIQPSDPDWVGGNPWLGVTKTDRDGKYQVDFPLGAKSAMVHAFGLQDKDGNWHGANANPDGPANTKHHQMMIFDELKEKVVGADWTLGEPPKADPDGERPVDGFVYTPPGALKPVILTFGPQAFRKGDRIEITEVKSTSHDLKLGDIVTVKGKGILKSFETANLCLYLTSKNKPKDGTANLIPNGPWVRSKIVSEGEFEFELATTVTDNGYLHLTFYGEKGAKTGKPLGGVYFGTKEQMDAIKEWDVSYYLD